jgi:riboflavin kinase/FMN adenylyltransferase
MANIGVRPTIEKGGKRTFEVNIFDFDGDLYGKTLRVDFVKFMRSEMKMGSFDELKERLKLDALACRKVLG